MKIDFDKLTKGVLILSFLLAAFSFFYYYVIFLPQKEQARLEQEHKEYVAKRRLECYDIYFQEKENRINVERYFYQEKGYGLFAKDDVCIIIYKNLDWKEGDPFEEFEDTYFTREY